MKTRTWDCDAQTILPAHARHKIMNTKVKKSSHTDPFIPALPSRATRRISRRSKVSGRAATTAQFNPAGARQTIECESLLELKVLYLLLARADVRNVWEQPSAIFYIDHTGKSRKHTFDYLVTYACGRRDAVIVKPHEKAMAPRFQRKIKHIRASVSKKYADRVVLVTDAHFTRDEVQNASAFHMYSRFVSDADLTTFLKVVNPAMFPISVSELEHLASTKGETASTFWQVLIVALYRSPITANLREAVTPRTMLTWKDAT